MKLKPRNATLKPRHTELKPRKAELKPWTERRPKRKPRNAKLKPRNTELKLRTSKLKPRKAEHLHFPIVVAQSLKPLRGHVAAILAITGVILGPAGST